MTDRPIIFSAPMICALLDGRKTQTRRLFRPRGFEFYTHPVSGDRYNEHRPYRDGTWDQTRLTGSGPMRAFDWTEGLYAYLPYAPGDRCYVREAWLTWGIFDDLKPSLLTGREGITYLADVTHSDPLPGRKRPGMHMPRWASRITLTITDVRVERVQSITEADALGEGTQEPSLRSLSADLAQAAWSERQVYQRLWDSLHTKDGDRWADNPWCYALTFTVSRGNIDQVPA